MKRRLLKLAIVTCFILAVTALFTVNASADTYGDLTYTVSNGEVTITDCSTSATSVTIPSTINGNPVTSIGRGAFYNCSSLTSVNIPDSVTSIGSNAFSNCTSLTSVNITDIAAWCNISFSDSFSNPLYYAKNLYLNGTLLTELAIPDSVTSIGDYAFRDCTSLTSISIPDSVTTIGERAFSNCANLTSISIGNDVTSIGDSAFYNCTKLAQLYINAANLTDLSSSNFVFYCAGQSGDGITVNIGKDVKRIPDYLFYFSDRRWSPKFAEVTFEEGSACDSIGKYAFSGCRNFSSISIPDSITSIGEGAFYFCNSLTRVDITDLASWCNISFENSSSNPLSYADNLYLDGTLITKLVIPDNITSINDFAFYNCRELVSISIPNNITSIGTGAFIYCSNLTRVDITDLASWCNISFEDSSSNPLSYADNLYLDGTLMTKLVIPDNITSISDFAFYNCSKLVSISIPDSVTSIGTYAFYDCTSLTSISIPDSVTSIGNGAFYYCSKLNTVYYCGTAAEWNGISIGSNNTDLTYATREYHKYTWTTTEPTCTEDGKKITKCEFCDFESNEPIPALGHCWSDWGEKIAPSCSVAGFERRTCSACNSQETRIVAPRHTWGEWVVHAEPTCTESGSRSRNCQACGLTETEELGILGHDEVTHAAQAPTCTSVGWHEYTACTRCGQNNYVEIPALGHSWEAWHTIIYPTADSVGFKERCCSACSDEEFDYVYFASGDVDGDGKLTNADLTLAVRAISGWNIEGNVALIDVNYDGKINNRDIIVLIKKLADTE